jgi:hypothetical protein
MSQVKGLKELKLPVRQRRKADMHDAEGDIGTIIISAWSFFNTAGLYVRCES